MSLLTTVGDDCLTVDDRSYRVDYRGTRTSAWKLVREFTGVSKNFVYRSCGFDRCINPDHIKNLPLPTSQKCSRCKVEQPLDSFHNNKSRHRIQKGSVCKNCSKERTKQKQKRYSEVNSKRMLEEKLKGCVVCGEDDLNVLQFHHIDPLGGQPDRQRYHSRTKDDPRIKSPNEYLRIGTIKWRLTADRFEEELKKCVVLCANDHLRLHAGTIKVEKKQ